MMDHLALFLFLLFMGGCFALLVKAIIRGKSNVPIFHDQDQYVGADPVIQFIPKHQVRNSHWFTHTFMRPRRKG